MSLLEIESLRVEFPGEDGPLVAVKGVDLAIEPGEVIGLVGESGSGKSLTCRAVMQLVPEPGRVAVMYGGHIVETGPVETIYHNPEHPYTRALLNSVPELDSAGNVQRRAALAGHPPELSDVIPGCVFAPRCEFARPGCEAISMKLERVGPEHASACPVRPFAGAGARKADEKAKA